jgi:CPA2 family monovalent cation:H+ antiporter-2
MMVVATPDTMKVSKMTDIARSLNPEIEVAIRCHSDMEANILEKDQAGAIFLDEQELAKNMVLHILQHVRRRAPSPPEHA